MDKQIFEGFGKFHVVIVNFAKTCNKDEQFIIRFTNFSISDDARVLNATFDNVIDTLFSEDIMSYINNDECLIEIENDTAIFVFNGEDYLYWCSTTRKRNKVKSLFYIDENNAETQTNTSSKPKEVYYDKNAKYSVAIADLSDEGLTHVDFTQGTKAECLKWLNNMIVRHTDLSEKSIMVFNLHFKQEDLEDIDKWKTLEELVNDKKVVI